MLFIMKTKGEIIIKIKFYENTIEALRGMVSKYALECSSNPDKKTPEEKDLMFLKDMIDNIRLTQNSINALNWVIDECEDE